MPLCNLQSRESLKHGQFAKNDGEEEKIEGGQAKSFSSCCCHCAAIIYILVRRNDWTQFTRHLYGPWPALCNKYI